MNFQPELAQAVMAGRKTVTRRLVSENPRSPWYLHRCRLSIGRDYAVCPGRGKNAIGRVRVTGLERQRIGTMAALMDGGAEARREGFSDFPAFHRAWVEINGKWDPDAIVWRVEFEVAALEREESR